MRNFIAMETGNSMSTYRMIEFSVRKCSDLHRVLNTITIPRLCGTDVTDDFVA